MYFFYCSRYLAPKAATRAPIDAADEEIVPSCDHSGPCPNHAVLLGPISGVFPAVLFVQGESMDGCDVGGHGSDEREERPRPDRPIDTPRFLFLPCLFEAPLNLFYPLLFQPREFVGREDAFLFRHGAARRPRLAAANRRSKEVQI